MKADEARSIAAQNAVTFENVTESIKTAAAMGDVMICRPLLSFDTISKLIEAGYSVSEHTDMHIGFKSSVICWR
jgi:hypothetical protein